MMASFFRRWFVVAPAVVLALLSAGCGDPDPILAPLGANLTLSTTASALSFNGTAAITARILTSQGQAAPDGTMVTFATTLGAVAPSEVPTAGGVATTTFSAGVASGTAVVTASSGSAGGNGVRIAIGAAAVARVVMTATPPTVPFGGGISTVAAVVVDANDNPLVGIPVTFSTTSGSSLTPTSVKTDPKGSVRTTLTTSLPATVTATAGAAPSDPGFSAVGTTQGSVAVTVAPQPVPVVMITPGANPVAQTPTTFTIGATPAVGSTTTIRSVSVTFGDGSRADLGAVSGAAIMVQHVYTTGGSYIASVTATDSGGGVATASTVIAVGFQAPVSVKIVADPIVKISNGPTSLVTLTATVAPASAVGGQYVWTFGDGSAQETTTLNQAQHVYPNDKTYTVKVDVTLVGSNLLASGSAIIVVP